MNRRVVKHGSSSYIISLPIKWIRKYGVEQGDELAVREENKSLIISSENTSKIVRIEIDGSQLLPRLVDRFMARSYQKGYDEILFIHRNPALLNVIKTKVHELIGYEIVEQDSVKCLIKAISAKIDLDFDNSLKRAFLIVKQMLEECADAYAHKNAIALAEIEYRDLEVNRLTYFCLRQINKEHYDSPERAQQLRVLYHLVEMLEDLGDATKKVATRLIKVKRTELFAPIFTLILEQYKCSYDYFYKPTVDLANRAYELYLQVDIQITKSSSQKLNESEIACLLFIKEITSIIQHFITMRLDYLKQN
ncbi:MAG: phosphate uptake regulator PhoU [Nanoarchaeota archaeon]|nr:phosphate uptake regulator PhoU [Nanoarchaeota archaeon]